MLRGSSCDSTAMGSSSGVPASPESRSVSQREKMLSNIASAVAASMTFEPGSRLQPRRDCG